MSIIFLKKRNLKKKTTLKQELSKTINFGVKPKMGNRNFVEKNIKFVGKKSGKNQKSERKKNIETRVV